MGHVVVKCLAGIGIMARELFVPAGRSYFGLVFLWPHLGPAAAHHKPEKAPAGRICILDGARSRGMCSGGTRVCRRPSSRFESLSAPLPVPGGRVDGDRSRSVMETDEASWQAIVPKLGRAPGCASHERVGRRP